MTSRERKQAEAYRTMEMTNGKDLPPYYVSHRIDHQFVPTKEWVDAHKDDPGAKYSDEDCTMEVFLITRITYTSRVLAPIAWDWKEVAVVRISSAPFVRVKEDCDKQRVPEVTQ